MANRPAWQAGWNCFHDLVLARQWIEYRPVDEVREWVMRSGFSVIEEAWYNRGPYEHEMIVAIKPG